MRFHIFCGKHLLSSEMPPGVPPLRACLSAPHEVALAHDPNKLALLVDNRHGADAVRQENVGHLLHPRIRTNADDFGNHHVGGFHVASSFHILLFSD